MKYKAIVFDVGDTLVEYSPNYAQIFGDKIRSLGFDVSEDMSLKISNAVYWASGEQIKKEQNGAPRATADELNKIMEIVLNEINLPPKDCLYVGDHPLDVFCSKQAGMDCAWISKFGTKLPDSIPYVEDYKINKVTQLLKIL